MVLVGMIWVLDWAFETAGQETKGMGPDAATYQPGLYLTLAQVSSTIVSKSIHYISKLCLKQLVFLYLLFIIEVNGMYCMISRMNLSYNSF